MQKTIWIWINLRSCYIWGWVIYKRINLLPAFAVDQNIRWFQVSVYYISRMDEICCIQKLIHDIAFMDVFQNGTTFNDIMQIALHEFEWQINIHMIGCPIKCEWKRKRKREKTHAIGKMIYAWLWTLNLHYINEPIDKFILPELLREQFSRTIYRIHWFCLVVCFFYWQKFNLSF